LAVRWCGASLAVRWCGASLAVRWCGASLAWQGAAARPWAILPILPGSIATGSRSGTPPPPSSGRDSDRGRARHVRDSRRARSHSRSALGAPVFAGRSSGRASRIGNACARLSASRSVRGRADHAQTAGQGERGAGARSASRWQYCPGSIGSIARLRGGHRARARPRTGLDPRQLRLAHKNAPATASTRAQESARRTRRARD